MLLLLMGITACSNRSGPAPVLSLSTKAATVQNLTVIEGDEHTVQGGDTLFSIAFYSGNDYQDIAKYNGLRPPYTIKVGQTIRLVPHANVTSNPPKVDLAQTEQKTNKINIDQNKQQEYGSKNPINHRKNKAQKGISSNNTYNKANVSNWIWPAQGLHTVATVGSDGSKRGLDIKGQRGASIVASAAGKVVYAGNALKGYGNLIIVKHNDQYLSAYAHNQTILVSERTYVKQGQKIATMGNTGSSEVMLHFEIRKKGKSVDPSLYLPAH